MHYILRILGEQWDDRLFGRPETRVVQENGLRGKVACDVCIDRKPYYVRQTKLSVELSAPWLFKCPSTGSQKLVIWRHLVTVSKSREFCG